MGQEDKHSRINPFPGLRPFLPEESDLFFGRQNESEEVVSKLLKNRFVTVMGASGTGKSSLIYCGVLPHIRRTSEKKGYTWNVLTLRPGNDPLGNLADAVVQSFAGAARKESLKAEIADVFRSNPAGLSTVIKDFVIRADQKILLVIDQFEELFRYSSSASGAIPGKNAMAFVSLLENCATQTGVEVYTIITMRSDFIGECAHFQGFTQLINASNYLVPHMGRENYRAAIEGPVKFAGAEIDTKLVETLLDHIGDQTDQLPVLQHALMRTWAYWKELDEPGRPLSLTDYDAVGTMSEAMSRHANEAFIELDERGKEICEKTFRTITEKGADNKGIRRPMKVSSIRRIIGCTNDELFGVMEKFRITSRSFITPREGVALNDDSVIDVSHESLMRLWDRLRQWVDEEAASVQMYLRLSEASEMYQQGRTTLWRPPDLQLAINWREQQKPTLEWAERYDPAFERAMVYLRTSEKEYLAEEENKIRQQKKQLRIARIVMIIVGAAAIISIGFMLFAFIKKIEADRQTVIAEEQKQQAVEQREISDSLRVEADTARVQAQKNAEIANQQSIIARNQTIVALNQTERAEKEAARALMQENIARIQADSASRASIRAEQQRKVAEEQRATADTLRMRSVGKQISIKSLQLQGQKDLQTLLAYQAYLFNTKYRGPQNDADIYQGLYNVARQYGNPSYKVFKGHASEIKSIVFVPGKREFYTAGGDNKVMKGSLDSKDQNLQLIYSGTEVIEVLAVSPDAEWLACGGNNSIIKMIPIKGSSSIGYDLKGHTKGIKSLVFSYDGKYLYSASLDGKVLKWDLAARTSSTGGPEGITITSIDISSNGRYLAGFSMDGKALVWNTENNTERFRPEIPSGKKINVIRFKPEANTLAIGYDDGYVDLWDIESGRKITSLKAHDSEVNDIRFNNALSQMATGGKDNKLKLWDTRDLTFPPITFSDEESFVLVVEFSPGGDMVVSGHYLANDNNLVGRPTSVAMLQQDICRTVTRNMFQEEWDTYVGKDVQYQKTCPDKEVSIKVNAIR